MVIKATATVLAMVAMGLFVSACGDGEQEGQILRIAGIPDQNATRLARRYELLTSYLSEELGVKVEYVPTRRLLRSGHRVLCKTRSGSAGSVG